MAKPTEMFGLVARFVTFHQMLADELIEIEIYFISEGRDVM